MWLPNTVYDRAPHYWFLLGLLMIVVGAYLGFEISAVFLYVGVGVGVACCIWSFRVLTRRKEHAIKVNRDAYLDQTCELNYKPDDS